MEKKSNKLLMLLIIVVLIASIIVGTYAYFSWQTSVSQQTNVIFTTTAGYSCAVDGGGNITGDAMLAPTNDCNGQNAIKRTIKVMPTITDTSKTVYADVWFDIDQIGNELTKSRNLKYALTTNDESCSSGVVSNGTFTGKKANNRIRILNNKSYNVTTIDTYYLYIWLDSAETSTDTMNQNLNLSLGGECVDHISTPEAPVFDTTGMIPVVYDTSGADTVVKTISSNDSNWYNYDDKKWANAVLVSSTNRASYLGTSGVTIPESDILAYYVWIPRYKYKIWTTSYSATGLEQEIDVQFEDKNSISNGSTVGTYITHPAFWWDKDNDNIRESDEELSGIWVGKFETTGSTTTPTIKPNSKALSGQNVSDNFSLALKFAGGTLNAGAVTFSGSSTYGLSNAMDSHMSKNNEWSSIAYLSHSQYGIDSNIFMNNSTGSYTGRSGGNIGGSLNTVDMQYPANSTAVTQYYSYGYYSWDGKVINYGSNTPGNYALDRTLGTKASSTGNIYGIFDLSGGTFEFVMGVLQYNSINIYTGGVTSTSITYHSGFKGYIGSTYYDTYDGVSLIDLPPIKYYNRYTSSDKFIGCPGESCFGYSTFETNKWYTAINGISTPNTPWTIRGGYYSSGTVSGAFFSSSYYGNGGNTNSFRSVLIKTS